MREAFLTPTLLTLRGKFAFILYVGRLLVHHGNETKGDTASRRGNKKRRLDYLVNIG